MTGQLFEARSAVERNRAALESAKAHLESVLANMSAGVIVMDADGVGGQLERCRAPHPAGRRRARWPAGRWTRSRAWKRSPAPSRARSRRRARRRAAGATARRLRAHWQQQIEVPRRPGTSDDHDLTLLARGSRLPVGAGSGFIVVFDDISDVISAQRSVAWGEVARRLAHEIKNPLTPIQLSAERLQMKLADRLDAGRRRAAEQGHRHHRQPGRRDEAHGRRLPRLRQGAAGGAAAARPERADRRDPEPVPGRRRLATSSTPRWRRTCRA